MIDVILSGIAAVSSVATLGVVLLRPTFPPQIAPSVVTPELVSRFTVTRQPVAAQAVHARSHGPRFWIEANDAHGHAIAGIDWRGDSEAEQKERWTRLSQSSDVGTFTLHDSHHPGHRGRFSRGVE